MHPVCVCVCVCVDGGNECIWKLMSPPVSLYQRSSPTPEFTPNITKIHSREVWQTMRASMNTLTMSLHHAQLLLRVMQSEQRVYVEHSEEVRKSHANTSNMAATSLCWLSGYHMLPSVTIALATISIPTLYSCTSQIGSLIPRTLHDHLQSHTHKSCTCL